VPAAVHAQTIAITGGTVHPVSGPPIEHGTVVVKDGMIVAVGADVTIPDGATRIDATGKAVTPGLFHAATSIGVHLLETGGEEQATEDADSGAVSPSFAVAEGINPASIEIPVARMQGITTAVVLPDGDFLPGQAAVIHLDGGDLTHLLVRPSAAMVANLGQRAKSATGGSRASTLQRLRQLLRDAREYDQRRADFRRAQIEPLSAPAAELEALLPVLRGELPLYVYANRRSDIESALRVAQEFKLRLVLRGAAEGWQVARELAAAQIPVVVEPLRDIPDLEAPAARLDNAALLADAGVRVSIAQPDEAHSRDLRLEAGNAVRNGMKWEAALGAVTLEPARAFGLGDRYGSLEAGKVADVVVWAGDPLDLAGVPEHVLIRGREVPLVSRQTELRERYRTLPPTR
jgi:imidazolonepropionase-like amidohydrolase